MMTWLRIASVHALLLLLGAPLARAELIWLDNWQVTRSGDASASFWTTADYDYAFSSASARADLYDPSNDYNGFIEIFRAFEIRDAPGGSLDVTVEVLADMYLYRTPVGMSSGVQYSVDFAGLDRLSESILAEQYGDTWTVRAPIWRRTFQNGEQGYIRVRIDAWAGASGQAGGSGQASASAYFDVWIYPAGRPVPEPSGLMLLGIGVVGAGGWRAIRRRRATPAA